MEARDSPSSSWISKGPSARQTVITASGRLVRAAPRLIATAVAADGGAPRPADDVADGEEVALRREGLAVEGAHGVDLEGPEAAAVGGRHEHGVTVVHREVVHGHARQSAAERHPALARVAG